MGGGIIAHKAIFPKNAHMGMICSALNGFVIGAADELKDRGVRINVIHPPLLQETAVAFGISGDGIPPAKEAAKCYAKCLFQESGSRKAPAVKSTFWIALERMIETKELSLFSS